MLKALVVEDEEDIKQLLLESWKTKAFRSCWPTMARWRYNASATIFPISFS